MSIIYKGKQVLKQFRWQWRRAMTVRRYSLDVLQRSPKVFGNAMPKSGSHLLTQILGGLTTIGPFVDPGYPPVNRSEDNHSLNPDAVIKNIREMRSGDIRYGYIHALPPYLSELTALDRATIFLYRDPRDMLVSHIFYAKDMYEGHGMHRYYTQNLTTMEDRLNAAIQGVSEPGFELASVKQRYDSYQGWLEQPDILSLKFEDLILNRETAINHLLDYLETRGAELSCSRSIAIEQLKKSILPGKSGTFRKGQPGNWREHFTEANKAAFNQVAGDLLVHLGYEQGPDW
jgi:hypothetical protein